MGTSYNIYNWHNQFLFNKYFTPFTTNYFCNSKKPTTTNKAKEIRDLLKPHL